MCQHRGTQDSLPPPHTYFCRKETIEEVSINILGWVSLWLSPDGNVEIPFVWHLSLFPVVFRIT